VTSDPSPVLPAVEGGDDGGVHRRRGRVIAHARHRHGQLGVAGRPHHVHQARSRPPGRGVEGGAIALGPVLAVRRQRPIDQPLVERHHVLGLQPQPLAHREGIVRDEDVGALDQLVQERSRLVILQVEGQALLVAGVERPEVVDDVFGAAVLDQRAIGVALARGLDLDHPRAEVRHDRRRGGAGDEAGAIDDEQIAEKPGSHAGPPNPSPPELTPPARQRRVARRAGAAW